VARQAGQIINRGRSKWLVRVYLGEDPETFVELSRKTSNEFLDEWLDMVIEERVHQRTLSASTSKC